MTVVIVSSTEDPASTNIKKGLLQFSEWEEFDIFSDEPVYRNTGFHDVIIVTIKDRAIKHENLDREVEEKLGVQPEQMIYVSRHRSQTGEPTLTTHPIGNYGEAQFGGRTKTLCNTSPRLMTCLLQILKRNADNAKLYHKVCFEVTHHGPYLDTPTFFAEVGSTEEEWKKRKPAEVVAQSILELLKRYRYEKDLPSEIPVLIGIGGGHYAPRFTDVVLEKQAAFGHMIPTYQINAGNFNELMLDQVLQKTPDATAGYFHRKALKKAQMREFKTWFKNRELPVISSKELQDLMEETL